MLHSHGKRGAERKVCRLVDEGRSPGPLEWLHRREDLGLDSMEALACVDQAEQRVIWDLSAVLETILVEPFGRNYDEVIEGARARLRDVTD